jgi:hypothetical protein
MSPDSITRIGTPAGHPQRVLPYRNPLMTILKTLILRREVAKNVLSGRLSRIDLCGPMSHPKIPLAMRGRSIDQIKYYLMPDLALIRDWKRVLTAASIGRSMSQ